VNRLRLCTQSAEATKALGAVVAELARPGDLLLLVGDMGAGKTAFAQGFAAGLGVTEAVTSPTFTLVREYEGRLLLHHLDVYRLDRLAEVVDLALPELLDDGGVTVIEWGEVVLPVLPADFLEVVLAFVAGDDDRREVTLRSVGPAWPPRWARLGEATEAWAC